MKKKLAIVTALALTAGGAYVAQQQDVSAEEKKQPVIAVVDTKKILEESKAMKGVSDQLQSIREKEQKEITTKEEAFKKEEKDLKDKRNTLAQEEFTKKSKDLNARFVEMQKDVQQKSAQLSKASNKAFGVVRENVLGIVSDMAKDKNYDIVLQRSDLMFARDTLDITEEVMKKLNDKLPSVKVELEKEKEDKKS